MGSETRRADAIVVGAGIVGCACAYRLAQRGLDVRVLEREASLAAGSTGRSAAGVRHQFADEVNVRLSMSSIDEYRTMPRGDFRAIGYLFYVPDALWDAQMDAVALQRRLGAPVRVLDVDAASRIVPVAGAGLRGATWCAADGVVDPHGLCASYAEQARAHGARIELRAPVLGIEGTDARWRVRTPAGEWHAPLLVNAAGAWAGRVAALAGLAVPVGPARRMVYASAPLDASLRLARPVPLTVDLATGVWFRSERERLIFGLANPADTGFEEGIDWPWLETTYEAALTHFPWFERLSIDRRASWWGYYEDTPDHNAIVGRMPGADGWINACGFSGHGVQQAGAIGRVVAQLALGEETAIDVTALRIERFVDGVRPAAERMVV